LESILIIIGVNLFVFVAVNIRPELANYLELMPVGILSHPWQIITSVFTHYDFFHIFTNMYTLYFFGSSVLQLLGVKRFWVVYIGGGLLGSILFTGLAYIGSDYSLPWLGQLYSNGYPITAIGASGAVFALGGALAVLRPNLKVFVFPIPAAIPLWIAVLGGFALLSFVSGIAWQAHLGGMLLGLAVGYYYRRKGY
jgi:membrane associated rhomboid family serine protease